MGILNGLRAGLGAARQQMRAEAGVRDAPAPGEKDLSWPRNWSSDNYDDAGANRVRLYDEMSERMGAMSSVGIVYALVDLIAKSAAGIPWHYDDLEGKQVELPELQALLRRPNPDTSAFELLYSTLAHLELTGNAFWYLEGIDGSALFATDSKGLPLMRNGGLVAGDRPHFGKPKRIYTLEPDRMKIAKVGEGRVAGYGYRLPTTSVDMPLERDWVVHFRYPHPSNRWWGLGPVEAAALKLETDTYSERWNRNIFRNSAMPGGVVEIPAAIGSTIVPPMTDAEFDRLKREWAQSHKGVDNAHRIAILEHGAHFTPTLLNARDVDFLRGREMTREELCSIFHVPPAKIGVLRYANYANSREQDKTFWAECMGPKLALIAAKITAELVARYRPDAEWAFADVNPRDAQIEAQVAVSLAQAGLRTINELRAEFKWGEPVAWGDQPWFPAILQPVADGTPKPQPTVTVGGQPALPPAGPETPAETPNPEEQPSETTSQAPEKQAGAKAADEVALPEAGPKVVRPPEGADRAAWEPYWRAVMAGPQERAEADFKRALLPLLQEQQREVIAGLKASDELAALVDRGQLATAMRSVQQPKWRREDVKVDIIDNPAVREAVEGAIEWPAQVEHFRVEMLPEHQAALKAAGIQAIEEVAVGLSFDLADPDAVAALDVISHTFAADVTATTKQAIQDALFAGLQEGEGIPKLMDRVTAVFGEAKGWRAENIARTETARAVNQGRTEGFRQSGVVERREWIATMDARTRETHLEAHGQIVGIDEPFIVGGYEADSPGSPDLPPEESCACRCTTAPVIEEQGGEG